MEMDSELELLLTPSITPQEQELSHSTEDSTQMETETHSSLDSKTLPQLKTTILDKKLSALEAKSQTVEMETISKLEHQLILKTINMDSSLSHLDKDSTHKETETHSKLVSKTLQCSDKTQTHGHQEINQFNSKTLPQLKTTKEEEQSLTLEDKSQTQEVETPTKLEPLLLP